MLHRSRGPHGHTSKLDDDHITKGCSAHETFLTAKLHQEKQVTEQRSNEREVVLQLSE